jgi:hypothetical protein
MDELKRRVSFEEGSEVQVPDEFIKLRCNLEWEGHVKTIKNVFPSLKKTVQFVRQNMDTCYEWLLPKEVPASEVDWLEGEYKMRPGDSVSRVLYAVGALPLWEPWGVVRLSGQDSQLSNVNQVKEGYIIQLERTPVIRKCNAVFEEDGKRFHLAEHRSERCPKSNDRSIAQENPRESLKEEPKVGVGPSVVATEVMIEGESEPEKEEFRAITRKIAEAGNLPEACNNQSALEQLKAARSQDSERVDLVIHEVILLMRLGKSSEAKELAEELLKKSPALKLIPAISKASLGKDIPEAERCSEAGVGDMTIQEEPSDSLPTVSSGAIPLITQNVDVSPVPSTELIRNGDQAQFFAFPLDANFVHEKRYSVPVSLRTESGATIIQGDKILNTNGQGLKRGFNLELEVIDRKQCATLQVIERNLKVHYKDICIELEDEDLERLGLTNQAFYWRKKSGLWAQGGVGFVSQSFPGLAGTSSADSGTSIALRAGVGGWWKKFHGSVLYRRQMLSFAGKDYSPSWMNFLGGYSLELPRFANFTTFITPLIGMEIYRNTVGTDQVRFIRYYNGFSAGLETRFVIGSRFEVGGTYLYGGTSDLRSHFIQGDARYWFDSLQAVGFGSWGTILSTPDFRETGVAGEIYYRRIFQF